MMSTNSRRIPSLYTYVVKVDDGAAPNPFGGMCTLAICKPGIRRTAQVGDWIAGFGSSKAQSHREMVEGKGSTTKYRDLSGRLVYAMRVSMVLSLEVYDKVCKEHWPRRIPKSDSFELSDRLGDCIYDYSQSHDEPTQRPGVHDMHNMKVDLGGCNVLISNHYRYFGSEAIKIHSSLQPIIHQGQGHRRQLNDPYVSAFVSWFSSLQYPLGMNGWPDYDLDWGLGGDSQSWNPVSCAGAVDRSEDDDIEEMTSSEC